MIGLHRSHQSTYIPSLTDNGGLLLTAIDSPERYRTVRDEEGHTHLYHDRILTIHPEDAARFKLFADHLDKYWDLLWQAFEKSVYPNGNYNVGEVRALIEASKYTLNDTVQLQLHPIRQAAQRLDQFYTDLSFIKRLELQAAQIILQKKDADIERDGERVQGLRSVESNIKDYFD